MLDFSKHWTKMPRQKLQKQQATHNSNRTRWKTGLLSNKAKKTMAEWSCISSLPVGFCLLCARRASYLSGLRWEWLGGCVALVGLSLTSLCSTNTAKGQGWKVICTQWRKASDILTSTLAAFLFSSHRKRERDREAHLNYYASDKTAENNYRTARLN